MGKKRAILLNVLLCAAAIIFSSSASAEPVILNEMELTENDAAVRVLFSTSKNTSVECYDLLEPPQIIVDFMGEIFTKQPEIILVNKGVIKQMRVIKGTRKDTNLEESYYPADFIIVDLKEPMRYDFDRGLTTAVLVVAKPGKVATAALAKKSKEPVAEMPPKDQPQPEVAAEPEEKTKVSIWEEKEYEAEDVSFAAKKLAGEEPEAAKKEVKTVAEPEKKKSVGKKVARGIGSVGRGVKRFFSREKKEIKPQEAEEKKEAKKTKKERKIKKKEADKKTAEITAPEEKVAVAPLKAEAKEIVAKEEKPSAEVKGKRAAARKKPARIRKKKESAKRVSDPEEKIEQAKKIKQEKIAAFEETQQYLETRKAALRKLESGHKNRLESIEAAKSNQEKPRKAFEQSMEYADLSREAANSAWKEYTDAKAALSELLKQGATGNTVRAAQGKYEEKKGLLEITINNAQTAKEKSDEKLLAYNKVKEELERVTPAAEQPYPELDAVKNEIGQLEQKMLKLEYEVVAAYDELENLEREKKAYLLEKEEGDYKQFLEKLDAGSAESKAELLKKDEEREKAWADALKKLETQRSQTASKEWTVAEAAKKEEKKTKAKKVRKKREKKEPKKTVAPIKKEDEGRKVKKLRKRKIEETKDILPPKKMETPEKVAPDKKEIARADAELTKGVMPPAKQKAAEETAVQKKVQAKESLETVIELRNLGLAAQKKSDLDGALKYYQNAVEIDPNYATAHNDMGILYEQKGMDEKAKMAYLNALKADPRYIRAHSNLALLYEKSGDYNKAYYHWKQRVELGKPDDPWTLKAKERLEELEKKK